MIKKTLFLLLFTLTAFAQEEYCEEICFPDPTSIYAKIFGGANFLQDTTVTDNQIDFNHGYIFAGSLGYQWHYGLHAEAEYAFRRNSINEIVFFSEGSSSSGYFQTSSWMANLIWHLPLCIWGYDFWDIQPLIGAGIGCDIQHMHASNSRIIFNEKWHHFSWQLIAGFAYPLFCNTELSLEYKFHQGGSHFNNHAVGLGLTYHFYLR